MTDNPAALRHDEGVRLEIERLVGLYAEHGHRRAEYIVGRAVEEMAAQIADLQQVADTGPQPALVAASERLMRSAMRVGLTSVARVARDVGQASHAGDRTALAAILARLTRIGDRSLTAIWDLLDHALAPP